MTWGCAFARAFAVDLPWFALLTLGLGTWCVYVADRLLDGWREAPKLQLRERHLFYVRHRRIFVAALILTSLPLAYLIFHRVAHVVRMDDILLGLVGLFYFLAIHKGSKHSNEKRAGWMPKEITVGILFAIATTVPIWSRRPADEVWLLVSVALYAGLCSWNCIAIQMWEDRANYEDGSGKATRPTDWRTTETMHLVTRWLGGNMRRFALILAFVAAGLATMAPNVEIRMLLATCSGSALLFLMLNRFSIHMHSRTLRVAADLALLTPLLWIAFVR